MKLPNWAVLVICLLRIMRCKMLLRINWRYRFQQLKKWKKKFITEQWKWRWLIKKNILGLVFTQALIFTKIILKFIKMIAKITYKNDDKVKYIANAINLKGFLGGEKNIGVGEKREICFQTEDGDYDVIEKFEKYNKMYMPFYCTEKIKKNYKGGAATFKKEVAGKNPDLRDLVGTYLEKYLIKWGDNESIFVEDSEIAQRNLEKKIEAKILSKEMAIKIGHSNCGFYFKDRVPNSIFNLVRNVGEYWSKAKVKEWNEDCDDWNEAGHAGWYFSNEMISILKQNNYEIEQ